MKAWYIIRDMNGTICMTDSLAQDQYPIEFSEVMKNEPWVLNKMDEAILRFSDKNVIIMNVGN